MKASPSTFWCAGANFSDEFVPWGLDLLPLSENDDVERMHSR
jgi:hypothetical protein